MKNLNSAVLGLIFGGWLVRIHSVFGQLLCVELQFIHKQDSPMQELPGKESCGHFSVLRLVEMV